MLRTTVGILVAASSLCSFGAANLKARTVTLIPPSEPAEYTIVVKSSASFLIPLAATATQADSKQKSKTFTDTMRALKADHTRYLTEQVVSQLQANGYAVHVMDTLQRRAETPDSIDYEKLEFQGDIALQISFEAVGYYSGFGSAAYAPKVNVNAIAFTRGGKAYPYEATIYFGVDARAGKDWAILAPETASFPSFEALVASTPSVDAVYQQAFKQIAERLVSQFRAAVPAAEKE